MENETKNIFNFIGKSLENILAYDSGNELELRVGKFKTDYGYTKFVSEISGYVFNNLLLNLIKDGNYTIQREISKITIFEYNKERYRYLLYDDGKFSLRKKRLIKNIDIQSMDIRISYNDETDFLNTQQTIDFINNIMLDDTINKSYKDRIRTRYFHKDGEFSIDLTVDTLHKTNRKVYQWEVELLNLEKIKESIKNVEGTQNLKNNIISILNIINFINNLKNNLYYEDYIQTKFNTLYSREDKRDYKKPVNIKVEDIPYLSEYIVRPKLDGVAYFIMIIKEGIFAINPSEVIKLELKESLKTQMDEKNKDLNYIISQWENTIILSEYMENIKTFYNYLLIKNTGKSVRTENITENMDVLSIITSWMNNICDDKFNIIDYSKIIDKMYILDMLKNVIENVENKENTPAKTIDYMQNRYNLPMDGLIFEPIYRNKTNISYKWKPSDKITIDFLTIPTSRKNIYMVLSRTKEGFAPFLGTENNPVDEYVYIDDEFIKENGNIDISHTIIEYGVEEIENIPKNKGYISYKLYPYRVRWDKIEPNYIDVVYSTWDDITYPLSMSFFKEIIGYQILNRDILNGYGIDIPDTEIILYNTDIICILLKLVKNPLVLDKLSEYTKSEEISNEFRDVSLLKLGMYTDKENYNILEALYEYFTGRLFVDID